MKDKQQFENIKTVMRDLGSTDVGEILKILPDGYVLDELSPDRANIISWIPNDELDGKTVLEINGGSGITTGYLAEKAKSVTTICISEEQTQINRFLNENKGCVEFVNWDLNTEFPNLQQKYDRVFVFNLADDRADRDWIQMYQKLINDLKPYLSYRCKLYFSFENKYGLRFWNGLGTEEGFYAPLMDAKNHFLSKKDIVDLLHNSFGEACEKKYYYPYPNDKHTRIVFSDERLPQKDELVKYFFDNLKYEDLNLFNDVGVWNNIVKENKFDFFSNSFFVEVERHSGWKKGNRVVYSKFSNDRAVGFRIRTDIIKKWNGTFAARKTATNTEAKEHIKELAHIESLLKKRYANTSVSVVDGIYKKNYAESPFVNGKTLESLIEKAVEEKDETRLMRYIDSYREIVMHGCKKSGFVQSESFKKVFGEYVFERDQYVCDVTDIDLNFDNILVNNKWNLIDYEWTFDFEIPQNFVIYRALKYWRQAANNTYKEWDEWMHYFDISEDEQRIFEQMESSFQKYVVGDNEGFHGMCERYRNKVHSLDEILRAMQNA